MGAWLPSLKAKGEILPLEVVEALFGGLASNRRRQEVHTALNRARWRERCDRKRPFSPTCPNIDGQQRNDNVEKFLSD